MLESGDEPASQPSPASFLASARRASSSASIEGRLFEIVGGWVPAVAEPGVKLWLRGQSFRHARRAAAWTALVPVSGPVQDDGAGQPRAADIDLDRLIAASASTEARLRMLAVEALPALAARYEGFAAALAAREAEACAGPERTLLAEVSAALRSEIEAAGLLVATLDGPLRVPARESSEGWKNDESCGD